MRRQKCAQCGTMLDISKLESGSKFACASCGAILVVGEATAVKKSFKESGPAFTPKGKSDAPAPAPTRSRPATERAPRGAAGSEPKSKVPLFVGAGVVVVIAVVAIVLSSGGGGGPGGTTGTSAADWWAQQEPKLMGASADELRRILNEGRARYGADKAFWGDKEGRLQTALAKKDPTDAAANASVGNRNLRDYTDFDKIHARMQENFNKLPEALQDFAESLEVSEGKPVWVTREKYEEASAKLDEYVAWQAKADENPAADAIESFTRQAKTMLSSSQRKVGFAAIAKGPFVLLLAYEDNEGANQARADLLGEGKKWAAVLEVVRQEFDKRVREPLGLPAIEAGKYYCDLVVPTADDLGKVMRPGEGLDATGDIPGRFSLTTKWTHLRVPKEANEKALFGGDLAHEAVHQLQWHYSADPKQKLLNHMEAWNGIWLTEGLAEYLGSGIDLDPGSGKASFSGEPPRRLEFLRGMRDNGLPLIPLRDLVQLRPDNIERHIAGTWFQGLAQSETLPEAAIQWFGSQVDPERKIFHTQSWLLVHFLYEAEGGKYRAKLMDLVLTALRGKLKPERYRKDPAAPERFSSADEAFVEILGLKDEASWQELQDAHDRHLRSLRGD